MSAEFFNTFKIILQVLTLIAFILIFLYLAYCEGRRETET